HIKRGTKRKKLSTLSKLIKKNYKAAIIQNISDNDNYLDKLDSICNRLVQINENLKSYDLSKKVILALGIRLKLEKILIKNQIFVTDSITTNQTAELFKLRQARLKADFIRLANKILVSTPEFIHL